MVLCPSFVSGWKLQPVSSRRRASVSSSAVRASNRACTGALTRTGCTWAAAMSVSLKAAQNAKAH